MTKPDEIVDFWRKADRHVGSQMMAILTAPSRNASDRYPIAPRIYADERSAVVHLGDGKMLDIRASGARLNEDAGVVFPTPFNMEPLPKLEDGAALEVLPEILDLSDDQCRLVLIWLMALFQPNGR